MPDGFEAYGYCITGRVHARGSESLLSCDREEAVRALFFNMRLAPERDRHVVYHPERILSD